MHIELKKSFWLGTWLVCLLCALPLPCHAETATDSAESRFLFVVDISSAMTKSAPQGLRSALELLGSNMQGQLRPGDTLGLWTFNDKLHTDAPMQVWSDAAKPRIMESIATHWRTQSYGKKAHIDVLLPTLLLLIKDSPMLTVIWITDGNSALRGTPFDSKINQLHAEYAKELHTANQCFVTVLACRNGEVIDYAVNSTIGPFHIPLARPPPKPQPVVVVTNAPPPKPKEVRQIVIGPPPKTNVEVKASAPTNSLQLAGDTNTAKEVAALGVAASAISVKSTNGISDTNAAPKLEDAPAAIADLKSSPKPVLMPTISVAPPAAAKTSVVSPEVRTIVSTPPTNPPATQAAVSLPPLTLSAPAASNAPAATISQTPRPADPAPTAESSGERTNTRFIMASCLLAASIILAGVLLRFLRKERAQPSLISESIKRSESGANKSK